VQPVESSRPVPGTASPANGSATSAASASPSISDTLGTVPGTLTDAPRRGRAPVFAGVGAAVAVVAVGLYVTIGAGGAGGAVKPDAHAGDPGAPTGAAAPSSASGVATTAAAAATAAPAVVPLIRQVRVESDPPGATVSEGDTQLCTSTPCELTWKDDAAKAEHKLQINKKGYKTYKATVGTGEDKTVAKLDVIPVPVAAPPPAPPPPPPGRPLYKKDF
jgi:serine/threonine-protein kinase